MQVLTEALRLALRQPSLFAFMVLLAQAALYRGWAYWVPQTGDARTVYFTLGLISYVLVPCVAGALLQWLLARAFIAGSDGAKPVIWGKFLAASLLLFALGRGISMALSTLLLSVSDSGFALTYGMVIIGGIAAAATFPLLVRVLLLAGGEGKPQLTAVFRRIAGEAAAPYGWFIVVATAFPALTFIIFEQLGAVTDSPNAGWGNLAQSIPTALGALLQLHFAIIAARRLLAPAEREIAVFS